MDWFRLILFLCCDWNKLTRQNVKEIIKSWPPTKEERNVKKKGILCKILSFHVDYSVTSWAVIHEKVELVLSGPQRIGYQLYVICPFILEEFTKYRGFISLGWIAGWMNECYHHQVCWQSRCIVQERESILECTVLNRLLLA